MQRCSWGAEGSWEADVRKADESDAARKGAPLGAVAGCLLAGTLSLWLLLAASPPGGTAGYAKDAEGGLAAIDRPDEFPEVDWAYWLSVNPDVAGWVTVPGTSIDHPIVQARDGEGDFYLSHGLDGSPDPMGCAFLDSDCESGLDSPNCVVYAHNWNGGRMFADFARFDELPYAAGHDLILLQTPQWKRKLCVQCVEVADGNDDTNVVALEGTDELKSWFQARYAASRVKLGAVPAGQDAPSRVYTFCTCVDDESLDQRVLVYATE